jgi:hypothetical protein
LAAYEILIDSIVDQLRTFFLGVQGLTPASEDEDEYQNHVLTRHKERLTASCLWLQECGVIGSEDLTTIEQIRIHRNEIAHELPHFIVDDSRNIDVSHFSAIRDLVARIDTWWIREVHLTINADPIDTGQVTEIKSGQIMLLDYLLDVVSELQTKRDATIH